MPLKPHSGTITIGATNLIVEDIRYQLDVLFFDRPEFSHSRLRDAPELDGTRPVFIPLPGGRVTQLQDGCVTTTPRSVAPDDSVYDSIYRRFDIKRWTIEGGSTQAALIDTVFSTATSHKVLLNRFEAHLAKARADISIDELTAMQAITFSYLTATGLSMSGMPLGSGSSATFTNIILVQFNPDVDYEEPLNSAGTSSRVMRRWSAVIEQRTEQPALSVSF